MVESCFYELISLGDQCSSCENSRTYHKVRCDCGESWWSQDFKWHKKSPRAIMYSMEQWTHPRRLRNFRTCESALIKLDMESLAERREVLCLQFATKCTTNPKWSISLKQIMKYIQCRQDLKNCMKYSMQILEGCRTLL